MATVDDLVAKALSTTSEDEAVACLRMARKRGEKMSPKLKVDLNIKEYNYTLNIAHQEIIMLRRQIELMTERNNELRKQYNDIGTMYHYAKVMSIVMLVLAFVFICMSFI